jgi:ADP-ribose pyrophosphatase YjhB (NUDIX family)
MKPKEVVTVFLRYQGKILLLKRSAEVGTYQNKWAGVSGYLEADPLVQAYTEVLEETSLEREDISPPLPGEPLDIFDDETQQAWRVYPFLADVTDPGKIRLDWENVEMRWVAPTEISRSDTVPGLDEALKRVWPEISFPRSP